MSGCEDIKPKWLSVARRLQEFSSHADGRSKMISITILVDDKNNPLWWYSPKMEPIEPKLSREQLLSILADVSE